MRLVATGRVGAVTIELGGNITLVGFSNREFTELVVVKKIVGQYARRCSDRLAGFESLKVALKDEGHGTLEVTVHLRANGHDAIGNGTSHNLFVALDEALKHAEAGAQRAHDHVAHEYA